MPLTPKGKKIQAAMKNSMGVEKVSKSSTPQLTAARLKRSREIKRGFRKVEPLRKPHRLARKRNRLERLNLRRVVRQRAKAELTKLATILSPD